MERWKVIIFLGNLYIKLNDKEKAKSCFELGCSKQQVNSCLFLGALYATTNNLKATKYLSLACNPKDKELNNNEFAKLAIKNSCFFLGRFYYEEKNIT